MTATVATPVGGYTGILTPPRPKQSDGDGDDVHKRGDGGGGGGILTPPRPTQFASRFCC